MPTTPGASGAAAPSSRSTTDAQELARALTAAISGEVQFDTGSRALYSTDSSNYRQVPIGVVVPRSTDDLVTAVALCRKHDAPLLMRGAGTSLCGQACNVAVVLDTSRYLTRVLEIDAQAQTALVEPGVVCDVLRDAAERHGLTFGPDPATHSRCTLGGMIGNNSCGAHSVMAGKTVENIEALEILTYDGLRMWVGPTGEAELEDIIRAGGRRGEIYAGLKRLRDRYAGLIRGRFPKIRRRVSGYNLDELLPENGFNVARALVGTEGTCAVVLAARAKLVHSPPQRVLVVLGYENIYVAADRTLAILEHSPVALEGLDFAMIDDLRRKGLLLHDIALLPAGGAWLLAELGAPTQQQAEEQAARLIDAERAAGHTVEARLYPAPAQQKRVWGIREVGAGASNAVPGEKTETYAGWEDAAVDPARLGDYLRAFRKLLDQFGYRAALYGHFGDGCIHGRITFDFRSEQGVAAFREFCRQATELVIEYGGSISGEHGDGQARAEFLPQMYGPELMQAFEQFKAVWDPGNRMNPGKVVHPYRVDENLKHGLDYRPLEPKTHFSFAADFGSFAHASARCVGVAKCRNQHSGTMCPSFRVTQDEQHSTRGRIRLLNEMLRGEVIDDLWDSAAVKQALDLCFACKGCKNDCPVQVDMATYKAEFLSHYYERHARPRQAYSMGLVHRWARLAAVAPRLVNVLTQTPGMSTIAKKLAGLAQQRAIPKFAAEPYTRWFARRHARAAAGPRVILWPDTFNNYFHPQTAIAATQVLEAAGFAVSLPAGKLCCGRPLYDFGMLERARVQLRAIMQAMEADIRAGTPIVGLEPACVSVFRDELLNLFPDDELALKLSRQTFMFAEFLLKHGNWSPRPLGRQAIVHGHCHQKSVLGMQAESELLVRLGVKFKLLDAGCCGMAGSLGFKPEHYDISIKAGELALLPAVRQAPADTLVIANGYSCREQVVQCTGRSALHIADVAGMALVS